MADDARHMLGPWMTGALVVGGMIGAGIFMLPANLAPLGPNAPIGWLVSGLGALSLAYALARLARQDGQGIQAYIERILGPTVGFAVTWAYFVACWAANAALAITTASALARIVPILDQPARIVWTAVALLVFLTAVNALGARAAGRLAIVTVAIKILPLLAVMLIFGQRSAGTLPFHSWADVPVSFGGVAAAAALTMFALLGFETATAPVGKVRDPGRNIPRALIIGVAFVALLYLLASSAVTLILPADAIVASAAPYADAVGSAWGEGAALFAAFAVAVSAFGCLNCGVLAAGELGFSMALRGDLPRALARTRRDNTPVVAQASAAAISILLVLANMSRETASLFGFVALLATSATLWLYLAGAIAALKLRPPPLPAAVIVGGIVFTAFAFYGSGLEANLWSVALLAAGLAIRLAMHRLNAPAPPAAAAVPAKDG